MTFKPHGKHLIAGDWVATDATFKSAPVEGEGQDFSAGNAALVDQACKAAEEAFWEYGYASRDTRAAFLNAIADEIEARGDAITEIGTAETGLPAARLQGERGRTTGQLRLFAEEILKGDYLDKRHDVALPDRQPLPRPDIRLMERPIGPVAVFGASNFPLAFSTAGGDTAAALAAGCPVVVKGHEAHPGTAEIVAEAIKAAIEKTGVPAGTFSMIHGGSYEVGGALVTHPLISAVGFTGSYRGGKALFDLCAQREVPIPFFGELGSINPMFMLPEAMKSKAATLGEGWAGSLTMGAGQFCTNPGIVVTLEGEDTESFLSAAVATLEQAPAQTMLTTGIAEAFRKGKDEIAAQAGVEELLSTSCSLRNATPFVYVTSAKEWMSNEVLGHEVFGPLGVVVKASDEDEMLALAHSLEGQLTCTLHMEAGDEALGQKLMPVLERKAGRILANGFPTGVEVSSAMVHGGPFPASTNFGATSVGTLAIRRFLRPVSYQNLPEALLPADLQG
ncbi:aldehyde dehydrogenase (NADP(+)) [Pseudooceanicola sp. HF7]|uniref:aldehyde dehydrogenase (NADP(+)) n=1 Tax=Pseudooceanicola sp. HF7 TaxID=2721560 RepID=UPI00142F4AB1|nr:aldehyde dehydrogenase (NADP(+)) [Pseudooceanicola sp. HF7]NIZ08168.1 aldehyde dehydrogenase (NADP(+)) [Pseudooceanicola sp. HF7]